VELQNKRGGEGSGTIEPSLGKWGKALGVGRLWNMGKQQLGEPLAQGRTLGDQRKQNYPTEPLTPVKGGTSGSWKKVP